MKATFIILIVIGYFLQVERCNAQAWVWAKQPIPQPRGYAYGDPEYDHSVAVDRSGNVYEMGRFSSKLIYGVDTIKSNFESPFLVKYDTNGNVLWVEQGETGLSAFAEPFAIATNGSGNIFEAGNFGIYCKFGNVLLQTYAIPPIYKYCSYLVKYDQNGNVIWAKQANNLNPSATSEVLNVAADSIGNTYVTGFFQDSVVFGTDTLIGASLSNLFLVKYDSGGNVVWARQSIDSMSSGMVPNSIAFDKKGNVYFTGNFYGTNLLGSDTLGAYNSFGMFVAKYDTSGNIIWIKESKSMSPSTYGSATSIAIDGAGDPYITGYFGGGIAFGKDTISGRGEDVFLTKFDTAGNVIWAIAGHPLNNGGWFSYSLACDTFKRGGGYMVIECAAANPRIKLGNDTLGNSTGSQVTILVQFDSTGKVTCSDSYSEGGEDDGDGVAVSPTGRFIYTGGDLFSRTIIGSDTLLYGTDAPFVARWKTCCGIPIAVSPIDTAICVGASVTLKSGGAASYNWSPSTGLNVNAGPLVIATPLSTTRYTVEGINAACAGSVSVLISVNTIPLVSVSPAKDSLCVGSNVVLAAGGTNILTYGWSPSTGLSCTTCASPTAAPVSSTTYTLVTSNAGCNRDTAVTITVMPLPKVSLTPSATICFGDSITLTATGGDTYHWSNNSTNSAIKVGPATTSIYSVTATKICSASATTIITVDTPKLFVCCTDTIKTGSSVNLSTTGSDNYTWSPGGSLSCSTCAYPVATPTITTTYTVMGTDANGCSSDRTVTIDIETPCADFNVPNIFTPNNDGINDDFVINVLNASSYNITIYDRWGKQVYTSANVNEYWNGRINGTENLAPDGTYYYVITASCGNNDFNKKGFVEVLGGK